MGKGIRIHLGGDGLDAVPIMYGNGFHAGGGVGVPKMPLFLAVRVVGQ